MNQTNEQNSMNAFERAAQLRAQAEAIEAKEKIRLRLIQLIEISKDPYYDQYLAQMMKDLESGKASPAQVEKEAERTFRLYQQRMGQSISAPPIQPQKTKDTVEFKVGAGIFSTLGAVFVLVALVIFGFNYLDGIWQGMCLYLAGTAVILLSELAVKRISKTFSHVISAIGISSLFIATVINYLVLKNINGLVASLLTIVIAVFSVLFSRKKEATSIRLIGCLGCYICFLPIKGFETELSFLIMAGMIFAVNLVFILLPNQKNKALIGCVHMVTHVIFTAIVTVMVMADGIGIMYVALFAVLSLVILNLIYLSQRNEVKLWFTIVYSIMLGIFAVILICIACLDHDLDTEKIALFYKWITEAMVLAVSFVFFIMWTQEKQRWIQYYFMAAIVFFFNGFTDYPLEATIFLLLIFSVTRLLCLKEKELWVLDSVLAVLTALQGIFYADEWHLIPFLLIMILSIATIRNWHIFHEIVLTVFFLIVSFIKIENEWLLPVNIGTLLVLFLLFNHLCKLKEKLQLPYNIVNLAFAGIVSCFAILNEDYIANSVAMLLGAVMIVIAFRKRYGLEIPKKYLVLAGYLSYMILAAEFETPVIVSALLMVVAIGCVSIGFKTKDKVYRICGLVMAIIVCIKMIIYDFSELETMAKALLFLIVGIIALAISFLYIYLEKKEDEEEAKLAQEAKTVQKITNSVKEDANPVKEEASTMQEETKPIQEEQTEEGVM